MLTLVVCTGIQASTTESSTESVATEAKAKKQKKNVTYNEKGEIIKTGINLGPLPVVAFDADRGFQSHWVISSDVGQIGMLPL